LSSATRAAAELIWKEFFRGDFMSYHVSLRVVVSVFAILSVVAVAPALAASDGNSLETVVVTATRKATPLGDVSASISVITAEEIADTPAEGLDDILRNLPGMTLNAMGPDVGHPTAYNESMRGLPTTETRMLVMVDGIPLNDPFFGYIQWNRVPLDNINHVEVVRGGGSPLWGSTAMGGVVNVITNAPQDNALDVAAAGGSYGSYDTSLYGSYAPSDWLRLGVNGAFRGTDGYQTTPASWTSFGALNLRSPVYTPTSNQARDIGLRADMEPVPDLTGFITIDYGEDGQVLSTPIGLDQQRIWTTAAGLTKTFGESTSLTATFFHDDDWFITDNPHLVTFTTEYNSNVHTTTAVDNGASVVLTHSMDGWLRTISIGADYHQLTGRDVANYYLPSDALAVPTITGGGDQLFLAGFGQVRVVPVDALELNASLRYQYYLSSHGIDTFPPGFGAVADTADYRFTPRVDARYRFDEGFAVRGAYYQSFRAPTLDQLYRTYADTTAGIYEGDPSLKPETLEGEEIGVDYTLPGLRSQFTLYNSTISDLVTQRNLVPAEYPGIPGVNCGYDPATFVYLTCTRNINAGSAVARGFEAEVVWEIADGFSSRWTYTYADSHYTADPVDPTAVGNRLEGVPMHNASAGITYDDAAGWQASAILRYISKSYGDAHPADGLIQNAHFVVDVSASYPLTDDLQAFVGIQNLFDDRYIASDGGGAPILGTPLRVMSGLRLKV
jgi:outer membrane receptor protein involved in Fe transport